MKRISTSLFLLLLLILLLPHATRAQKKNDAEALKTAAKGVVDLLVAENFAGVREKFSEQLRQNLSEEKMRAAWRDFTSRVGVFRKQVDSQVGKQNGADVAIVKCEFSRSLGYVQVIYDGERKIIGLWNAPLPPGNTGVPPPPPDDDIRFKAAAKEVVDMMAAENFAGVREKFNAQMQSVLSEAKLRDGWAALKSGVGNFQRQLESQHARDSGFDVVEVMTEFERSKVRVRVTYDSESKIAGLWLGPVQ